jgi:hypothetical protein
VGGWNLSARLIDTKRQESRSEARIPSPASQPLPSAASPAAVIVSHIISGVTNFVSEPLTATATRNLQENDRREVGNPPPSCCNTIRGSLPAAADTSTALSQVQRTLIDCADWFLSRRRTVGGWSVFVRPLDTQN